MAKTAQATAQATAAAIAQAAATQKPTEVQEPASPLAVLGQRAMALQAEGMERTKQAAAFTKKKTMEVVSDKRVQVAVASGAGGAAVVGTGVAAVGLVGGGVVGGAIGILPAIFTFGLSIPIGAMVGAGCGVVAGGAVGGTAGFTSAAAVGCGAYTKRAEIRGLLEKARQQIVAARNQAKAKAFGLATAVKTKALETCSAAKAKAESLLGLALKKTTAALGATKAKTVKVVSDKDVQKGTASAVGGAMLLGTGGACTGMLTGGAIGAAVGVVPAIFTFGLSIPFCAVIGGGCGMAAGSAVGGTTGAAAGAGGYVAYQRRDAIRSSIGHFAGTVQSSIKDVQGRLANAMKAKSS